MADQTNKCFWQRMAKLYAPFMKSSDTLYNEIAQRCRPYLNQEMQVLELACGSGQVSFRLAEAVRHWEATDFSEQMILEAQKQDAPRNLTFAVGDATNLLYPDGFYDAVLIANALHIMPDPHKALGEIARVLKPGGILMAPTFIWGADARQNIRETLMVLVGFRVLHRWDASALTDYVRQRGFAILEQSILGGSIRPLCCLIARKV